MRSIPQSPVTVEDDEHEDERERPSGLEGAFGVQTPDGALQSKVGTPASSRRRTSASTPSNGLGPNPPDSVGDVGPNHYVVMSNLRFAVYPQDRRRGAPRPAEQQHALGGLRRRLPDRERGRPGRPARPALGPLDPDAVHRGRPAASSSAWPSRRRPDPTGAYFRYAFPTGAELPGLPEVRHLARRVLHQHARVQPGRALRRHRRLRGRPRAAHRGQPRAHDHRRSWCRRERRPSTRATACCRRTSTARCCRRRAARTTGWARWTRAVPTARRRTRSRCGSSSPTSRPARELFLHARQHASRSRPTTRSTRAPAAAAAASRSRPSDGDDPVPRHPVLPAAARCTGWPTATSARTSRW